MTQTRLWIIRLGVALSIPFTWYLYRMWLPCKETWQLQKNRWQTSMHGYRWLSMLSRLRPFSEIRNSRNPFPGRACINPGRTSTFHESVIRQIIGTLCNDSYGLLHIMLFGDVAHQQEIAFRIVKQSLNQQFRKALKMGVSFIIHRFLVFRKDYIMIAFYNNLSPTTKLLVQSMIAVLGSVLAGVVVAAYTSYTQAGLPLSNERKPKQPEGMSITEYDQILLHHPEIVEQEFERLTLRYDPNKIMDNPPGSGSVYTIHLVPVPDVSSLQGDLDTARKQVAGLNARIQVAVDALKAA